MGEGDRADDALWDGFAGAVVRIEWPGGPQRLAPAPHGVSGTFPCDAPVHIVTAYNPDGVELDESANAARHGELRDAVRGIDVVATVGSAPDGSMPEPGYALLGTSLDVALALGRQFGQRAIYRWTADELLVVGVDETTERRLGWSLSTV